MTHSTPGLPVHHQLPEFTQTHVHQVSDAIQTSHPLLSPSPPAPNPSQHQSLFQWVSSLHEVAKVLEFTQGLIISIKTHLALLSKKKYQYCKDPNSTMYLLCGPKYPAWFFCAFNLTFGKQLATDEWAWAMEFQSWCYYSPVVCLWANVLSFLNTCLLLLVPWLVGLWSGQKVSIPAQCLTLST